MKTTVIRLERHDDLISARDKMGWSKSMRILLVYPERGRILRERLDLVLMERHAREVGAQLALVCRDPQVLESAHELGIPTFSTVARAQKSTWRKTRPPLHRLLNHRRKRAGASRLRDWAEILHPPFQPLLSTWMRIGSFLAGVLAVFALILFFLPSAEVILTPDEISQQVEIRITASQNTKTASITGNIPAYAVLVEVEGEQTASASGHLTQPDAAASGQVQFTNLTNDSVLLPAGTVIRSIGEAPQRYQTTESALLDPVLGAQTLVRVRAVLPGTAGNQPAGMVQAVEGNLGLKVSVTNPKDLRGGSERELPSPSETDIRALRQKLLNDLRNAAENEMSKGLPANQRLIPGSAILIKVIQETTDPQAGEPASQFRLHIRASFQAWAVSEMDQKNVANLVLNASLPAGYLSMPDSLKMADLEKPTLLPEGGVSWKMMAVRQAKAVYSTEKLASALAGKKPQDAQQIVADVLPLQNPVVVRLSPTWWFRLPFLPFRIEVHEP